MSHMGHTGHCSPFCLLFRFLCDIHNSHTVVTSLLEVHPGCRSILSHIYVENIYPGHTRSQHKL